MQPVAAFAGLPTAAMVPAVTASAAVASNAIRRRMGFLLGVTSTELDVGRPGKYARSR
ncbi:hypothetical protein Vau01_060260 [Virgisporangium aurantiacum]|uniref:Uncharacterized protein n=1 Tax=Virgisporangium aurantiacum TaxID=175570 RepID=A0A8J4E169_9ACTN|nr:hypothetical protein Vau01_060260 [Virgisporangium aurantiacum]